MKRSSVWAILLVAHTALLAPLARAVDADFNGDGRADILWRNAASGENYLYPMDGTQILAGEAYLRTVGDPDWMVVGVADFDGDGKADILWRNAASGENYLYFMDGATIKPGEGYIRTVADQNWQVAGVGDFNADGRADILWRNSATGENYLYPMNGLAILPAEGYLRTVAGTQWQIAALADFDGDGKADILWRHAATGENYLYPMDGTAIKPGEGYLRTVADQDWRVKGAADLDGDGKADIVWRNRATGENYLYPMNGTAILPGEGYFRTVSDPDWDIVAVADFDADGRGDLLWRNARTGENYLYPMDGTAIASGEGYLRTVADQAWMPRNAGSDPASLLAGAFTYRGPWPTPDTVSYVGKDGIAAAIPEAFPGFVQLLADPAAPRALISAAIQAQGGVVRGQIPRSGLYLVQVSPGGEAAYLGALFAHAWVREGAPASALHPGAIRVFDFAGSPPFDDCDTDHGNLVQTVAARRGAKVTLTDVVDLPNTSTEFAADPVDISRGFLKEMEEAYHAGERTVFNFSLQGAALAGGLNRAGCDSSDAVPGSEPEASSCRSVRAKQKWFWHTWLGQLDAVALKSPAVIENSLFVLIAGNSGLDLDTEVAALRTLYPNAFKHVLLVGGTTTAGAKNTTHNYLASDAGRDMVYALSENVAIPGAASGTCSGTSFAGPEVASALERIWSKAPGKRSDEVVSALYDALDAHAHGAGVSKRAVPAAGGYVDFGFMESIAGLLGATLLEAQVYAGTGSYQSVDTFPAQPGWTPDPDNITCVFDAPMTVELDRPISMPGPIMVLVRYGPQSGTIIETCTTPAGTFTDGSGEVHPVPEFTWTNELPSFVELLEGNSDGTTLTFPAPYSDVGIVYGVLQSPNVLRLEYDEIDYLLAPSVLTYSFDALLTRQ